MQFICNVWKTPEFQGLWNLKIIDNFWEQFLKTGGLSEYTVYSTTTSRRHVFPKKFRKSHRFPLPLYFLPIFRCRSILWFPISASKNRRFFFVFRPFRFPAISDILQTLCVVLTGFSRRSHQRVRRGVSWVLQWLSPSVENLQVMIPHNLWNKITII